MKNILPFLVLILIQSTGLLAQDWISVIGKSPFPANTQVFFTGFNGFDKIDLGSIRANALGEIDYFTDYHGFCYMNAEGGKSYPLILEHDPVCIEWGEVPDFTCEAENAFYYANLAALLKIDSLQGDYFAMHDTLDEKSRFGKEVWFSMEILSEELMNAEPAHAKVFLMSELMVSQVKMIDSTALMAEWKENILDFVGEYFEILNNSVYLSKLAGAYVGMNAAVFHSDASKRQAMEYDVAQWLDILGEKLGEGALLDFFMIHFIRTGEPEVASRLTSKYNDIVKCDQYVGSTKRPAGVPYTFNVFFGPEYSNVRGLDQLQGMDKILVFVSTECPASVASVAGLYDFVSTRQIRLPVILVPDYELEGELGALVEDKAPFSLRTGYKYGGALMQGAGVRQLPAFMMLDRKNLVKEIIYDIELLKQRLQGDD